MSDNQDNQGGDVQKENTNNDEQQQQQQQQQEEGEKREDKADDGADKADDGVDKAGDGAAKGGKTPKSGKLENTDAIPTAGGERLGEKHWGESKMVPDLPKAQDKDNVSSEEGQPDDQTAANTAKNTGGAAHHAGEDEGAEKDGAGKEKFTDKIKDKLGMGAKKE